MTIGWHLGLRARLITFLLVALAVLGGLRARHLLRRHPRPVEDRGRQDAARRGRVLARRLAGGRFFDGEHGGQRQGPGAGDRQRPPAGAHARDRKRLAQALINLLANAVKFTERGWVRLRAEVLVEERQRLQLRFEVRDTGIGIAPERQDVLFSAFEQADDSHTRQHGGTGLGLALTRQIAALMGGEAGLESRLGEGSSFWFTAWVARAAAARHNGRLPSIAGLRALLVDDLPQSLSAISEILTVLGLRVDAQLGGADAVRRAGEELRSGRTYDVMLIDWRMDGMDGIETAAQLRRQLGAGMPPCILVTAFNETAMWSQARQARFDQVLVKPVTASALLDALVRVLDGGTGAAAPLPLPTGEAEARIRSLHRGRRVLLAEDNPINQEVATELLSLAGLRVDVVADGARALERLAEQTYDLVLMDVQMPVMDGLTATRQARARHGRSLPIVAMTANAFGEDRAACIEAGMDDHIAKPVDPGLLFATVLRWLPASAGPGADSEAAGGADDELPLAQRLAGVDGLDLAAALSHTGGQLQVLERVLHSFVANYSDGATGLSAAPPDDPRRHWHAACHSLRGACSVIGADRLVQGLLAFERALKIPDTEAGTDNTALAAGAADLQQQLVAFVERLRDALGPRSF